MSFDVAQALRRWRQHLNPEASKERMALGFALLAGGAVLAFLGVLLVALGDLVLPRPSWLRELGFVSAAGGLPLFLTGLAIALPSQWWERALVATGLLASLAAVGMFSLWYPDQWHLTVQAPNGYAIGSYLVGTALIAAGTAACVGTYIIERAGLAPDAEDTGDEITADQIEDDLLWAERQGWTWGGIRQGRPDVNLVLEEEVEPMRFGGRAKMFLEEEDLTNTDVEAAEALYNLRGKQTKRETTDQGVGDQVGSLKQLKQQKAQQEAAERESLWWKMTHPFQALRGP